MARDIPYLDVQNLAKSFGALTLFENLSFSISEGQRVGLIAKNGTGKSTLLSIITGKESADSGSIVFKRDLRVAILEQSPIFNEEDSVLDACFNHKGDDNLILKAKQILTQLKISNLEQPVGRLSGGQQKRVALANVLITEPDLLILDEPTNHLDLRMIEWLEGYLSKGNRTLLMVTHDRFFLDRVCNVILELDNKHIYTYRGNYAYYLEKRQERIDAQRSEIEKANLQNQVQVHLTGCFGFCAKGPIVKVFPDNIFYIIVSPSDAEEIVNKHLINNTIIDRLLFEEPSLNNKKVEKHDDMSFYKKQSLIEFISLSGEIGRHARLRI